MGDRVQVRLKEGRGPINPSCSPNFDMNGMPRQCPLCPSYPW